MKVQKTEQIRNIALVSHSGAGKTSLTEAMLYRCGVVSRLGKVDDGTTASDWTPEEKNRKVSINASYLPVLYKDHKINIIDAPGYSDFIGDVRGSLRVADGVIILVCAASGVEIDTKRYWRMADEYELPKIVFVNKMNRESADFRKAIDELQENFGQNVVPVVIPIGAATEFKGVVDILKKKAYYYDEEGKLIKETTDIPAEVQDDMEEYRMMLVEALVETDDELLMKYLEEEPLSDEELIPVLGKAVKNSQVVPVLAGAATTCTGVEILMDYIIETMPAPNAKGIVKGFKPGTEEEEVREISVNAPMSAFVVKTIVDPFVGRLSIFKVLSGKLSSDTEYFNVNKDQKEKVGKVYFMKGKEQEQTTEVIAGDIAAVAKLSVTETGDTLCDINAPIQYPAIKFPEPMYSVAVYAKKEGDEEKVGTALNKYAEEDPTFEVEHNTETKELIVKSMGSQHIEVVRDIIKRKFNVEFEIRAPKIPYRETITVKTQVEEKYKKQTGGKGQYGHVLMRMEPLPRGEGFAFDEEIFGGAIPSQYIPAVEKGVKEAMEAGVLAGYPVVDVKTVVYDGSYHPVDSSEMAFKIAASKAFKKGMEQAKPILLEPIMELEIIVPEEMMGDIMGHMTSKRGKILGMEPCEDGQLIRAQAPLAEIWNYAIELKSMTGGQGTFTMKYSHYEKVPEKQAEEIIAARAAEKEE
ncbi:translation elongation factor G [Anoxybacter fermentans]|uniref:Elongation factor G n=1 Tax=Anoxybacter fermentans TaxID=1323375 RepID=A0A3S9SXL0_9FIRM|nr:elongation factor G [Anoxybacter fermentans]AZR72988.1 translation elongation factor G [Anoxybacter fermentans]